MDRVRQFAVFIMFGTAAAAVCQPAVAADSETVADTAMGTDCSARVYGSEGTAEDIMDMLKNIEEEYLSWRIEGSDIYCLNEAAKNDEGYEPQEWTLSYLEKIYELCEKSGGAFDPTLGAISELWNLGTDDPYIPEQSEIDELLEYAGWDKLKIEDGTVWLSEGAQLDLGAVGKGIGCQEALAILEESGAEGATVSVGGSIQLYGSKPDGSSWKVGITNPRKEDGEAYLGVLTLDDACSISTSGDYEKYVIEDGVRYHHILDPKTGYPAESGLISVTIVCDEGWLSDGLSTACFVLGYEDSLELLEEYDAEAVFVTGDMEVFVTDGLKDCFALTNDNYTLEEDDAQKADW